MSEEHRTQARLDLAQVILGERVQQGVLVREVLVQRTDGNPGTFGDPVGGGVQAFTLENLSSRLQDHRVGFPMEIVDTPRGGGLYIEQQMHEAGALQQGLLALGFIFSALAEAGKAHMTFHVNAALAIVGMAVLYLSHFPPASATILEESDNADGEESAEDDSPNLARVTSHETDR